MRKINLRDMFSFVRLIGEIGIKDDILELTENAESFDSLNRLGYEGIFRMLMSATSENAEQKIYEWLSGPFEKTPEEIGNIPYDELKKAFSDIFGGKKIKAFLQSASELMK